MKILYKIHISVLKSIHSPLYSTQGQHSEHEHYGLGVQQSRRPCWLWTHRTRHITHDR